MSSLLPAKSVRFWIMPRHGRSASVRSSTFFGVYRICIAKSYVVRVEAIGGWLLWPSDSGRRIDPVCLGELTRKVSPPLGVGHLPVSYTHLRAHETPEH